MNYLVHMKRSAQRLSGFVIMCLCLLPSCRGGYRPDISNTSSPGGVDIFQPDSASIAVHYRIPDWFRDGKLGIFIHWGVYSVPAFIDCWYPYRMYNTEDITYEHHVKTYGPVDEFGYKDFIPMFTAEKFDADEWIELFMDSGATYVVPVAEHHDGYAMYHSSFNPWNSFDMIPGRDFISELEKAARSRGMKFGVSSHRAENAWFYEYGMHVPSDVQDMNITLYGERIPESDVKGMTPETGPNEGSNERSRRQWLLHTYELVDKYKPDLMWFDWTVGKYPFQLAFYRYLAYYYNSAAEWSREVVVNTKFGYGSNIQVMDIERGKSDRILEYPWQTDTSIGKHSWSHNPSDENKTPDHIIDDFVDIVSKNGNLLLNVGPRADGSITEEQAHVLRELGGWLKVNGEAIYGSRPWSVPGEGDNVGTAGYMTDSEITAYNSRDIRFTTNNGNLYAIFLAHPGKEAVIRSLSGESGYEVRSVSMLGCSGPLEWEQTPGGLKVILPSVLPTDYAHVLRIEYDKIM